MILKKPLITEKTINDYNSDNKVTFQVDLKASKFSAAKAVEEVYNVTVLKAWVVNRLGKKKLNRITRKPEKGRDKKIMKFELKKGDKIDIFKA